MVRRGMTLTVGASVELNVAMQVGQTTQRVEVTADVPAIQTTSSEMGGEITQINHRRLTAQR